MARKQQNNVDESKLTERQREIRRLTAVPRAQRPPDKVQRLAELQAQERRERWERNHVKRVTAARKRLEMVARMGDPRQYGYTPEEGGELVKVLVADMEAIKRAFTGAPKEKGLYDL